MPIKPSLLKPPCESCWGHCCKTHAQGIDFIVPVTKDDVEKEPKLKDVLGRRFDKNVILADLRGSCPFLTDGNRCWIYKTRPQECREYNCWDGFTSQQPLEQQDISLKNSPKLFYLLRREYAKRTSN